MQLNDPSEWLSLNASKRDITPFAPPSICGIYLSIYRHLSLHDLYDVSEIRLRMWACGQPLHDCIFVCMCVQMINPMFAFIPRALSLQYLPKRVWIQCIMHPSNVCVCAHDAKNHFPTAIHQIGVAFLIEVYQAMHTFARRSHEKRGQT